MTGIRVSISPPTAEGRLYPIYDNGIAILMLGTSLPRPCPFGIAIDSRLILDFDEAGLLAGVELILPMSAWNGKAETGRPEGGVGNILLPRPSAASTDYGWPVTVSKDVHGGAARIDFGGGQYDRAVCLSEACYALLLADRLTGFWFTLAR